MTEADQTIIEQELMPCPFCGGPAELEEVDGGGWSVGCEEKALSLHYCIGYQSLTSFATKREAITAWNTRRPPYIGPPCSTCGAAHPFDNVFCSDSFHAPPDTLQSSAVLPSEAMVEAGAAALFNVSDFEGRYAELSEMSKQIYREKSYAVLNAAMRAATPTAPVQDDDAEWLRSIINDLKAITAIPGECTRLERIASRLSPTPETELVEALTRLEKIVGITLDKDFGFWSSQGQNERRAELYPAWVQARRTLDALSNVSRLEDN